MASAFQLKYGAMPSYTFNTAVLQDSKPMLLTVLTDLSVVKVLEKNGSGISGKWMLSGTVTYPSSMFTVTTSYYIRIKKPMYKMN